jgi:predicted ester cyclase
MAIEDQIAEGDKVVTRWSTSAVHTGNLMGIPASGKPGMVSGITISRVAGGRIAEEWTNWDQVGMLQQIGAIPTPGR